MKSTLSSAARLARWLGPWSKELDVPRGIDRTAHQAGATRAYVYASGRSRAGVYLVLPGLHFLGPDDPRLDRFCRILAASGFVVVVPFIRAYGRMLLDPSTFDDATSALALARRIASERSLPTPAAFSISFGSILALHLAASSSPPGFAVLFGGYADFLPTVRFAVTGHTEHEGVSHHLERDPLNSPVVFLNVLEHLDVDPADRPVLSRAWLAMVHSTWGKMELKKPGARDPIAQAIARELPQRLHKPFLRGCCLEPDSIEWLEDGLARAPTERSFLDPSPLLRRANCPLVLVHGRDDDVIPYFESIKLANRLPKHIVRGLHVTGLYGHTGAADAGVRALLREGKTMLAMLWALGAAPAGEGSATR